jgi:hypothetical protein
MIYMHAYLGGGLIFLLGWIEEGIYLLILCSLFIVVQDQ